jgi:HSP20 family molecular chaperone IbpA
MVSEAIHSDGRYHIMERCSDQFVRRMKLPESLEKDVIQADFGYGVLQVILPN